MGTIRPPMPGGHTAPQASAARATRRPGQGAVVAAVSAGGALGAGARYGAALLWPTAPGAFPWTTVVVNAVGCAVIGVLLTALQAPPRPARRSGGGVRVPHRLVRPFFGTGVLGGFTTFSTYAVDVQRLLDGGRPGTGLVCLALTPVVALAAVWGGARATRYAVAWRRR